MIPQCRQALLHIVRQGRSANIETQVDGARYLVDVLHTRALRADCSQFDFLVGDAECENGSDPARQSAMLMAGTIRACKQVFAMARFFSSYEWLLFLRLEIAGDITGAGYAFIYFLKSSNACDISLDTASISGSDASILGISVAVRLLFFRRTA